MSEGDAGVVGAPDAGEIDAGAEPDAGPIPVVIDPSWQEMGAGAPAAKARWGAPMVYVEGEQRFILFGGTLYPSRVGTTNQTWSFDVATGVWSEITPSGDVPAPRYCHCMGYIPTTNEVMVIGGRNDRGPMPKLAATLDLASNTFSNVSGDLPEGVIGCSAQWMPELMGGRLVVWGGGNAFGLPRDTFLYDPSTRMFSRLSTTTKPPGRGDSPSAYDPIHQRMLVFGGVIRPMPPYQHLNDLWAFDGQDWAEIPLSGDVPTARRYAANGVEPRSDTWVMFGGTREEEDYSDLWLFDLATDTFSLVPLSSHPDGRAFAAGAVDSENGALFVFGGLQVNQLVPLDDGWRLQVVR